MRDGEGIKDRFIVGKKWHSKKRADRRGSSVNKGHPGDYLVLRKNPSRSQETTSASAMFSKHGLQRISGEEKMARGGHYLKKNLI